jgi:hypothetical protein
MDYPNRPRSHADRDEIDQWTEANEQQAAEAHAAWSAGQDAVRP